LLAENSPITLSSEEDAIQKIVVPYLENLGFRKSEMDFEFPIKAQIGSGKAKTIFADIVVNVAGRAIMIVEVKKSDHRLEERDKEQAISYARLFDHKPINFALITNGKIWQVYRADTKERIPKMPTRDTWAQILADYKLTDEQKEEANYFAVEGYETVKDIENALRKCHDTVYSNDGLTPLQTFEEINKFIFAKIQEEKRSKKAKETNRFSTKYLEKRKVKIEMQRIFEDAINDFPKDIEKIFHTDDEIEICSESILQIVKVLENKGFTETDIDVVGMAYETFLKPVFRNKHLGQYFTPREIVEFMVDFLQPQVEDLIIDPAFGSGGFLVRAFQILKEKILGSGYQKERKEKDKRKLCSEWIFGTEIAPHLARACKINMYIHGDGKTGVYRHDGLVNCGKIEENKFDMVLTNPPFGGVINQKNFLDQYELGTGKKRQLKEVLFLERCIRLVKSGGKIGIILPDGILTNSSLQNVRDFILRECKILGIVSLPNHTFAVSGAGVKTSILFLQKKEKGVDYSDYNIFMSEVERVGYDATGRPDDNELGHVLDRHYEFRMGKTRTDSRIFF
jgi:type I restriction enzyme M protein